MTLLLGILALPLTLVILETLGLGLFSDDEEEEDKNAQDPD